MEDKNETWGKITELPVDRDKLITDKLAEIFTEWAELKIKLLCREQRISEIKMHLKVAILCMGGIIICLILLMIGVE